MTAGLADAMPSVPAVGTAPLRVGIVNARLNLQRHNTDHQCVVDMTRLPEFDRSLSLRFLPDVSQALRANANFVAARLGRRRPFPAIELRGWQLDVDALYQYGPDVRGLSLPTGPRPPLFVTTGFPSERAALARGRAFVEAQATWIESSVRTARMVHFHTDVARELYLEQRPADRQRCISLPFFLPHLAVVDEATVHAKFASDELRLLFVGVDGVRKGIDTLCEALDRAADALHRHGVQGLIVSRDAPRCTRFRAIRHERQLPRAVVQAHMRDAHIYCMVPRRESYGLVFVEAMAAGCAVVADDDLPRQEILDRGRCGVLLRSGDAAGLADELVSLAENRPRALGLALRAREKAARQFAPAVVGVAFGRALATLAQGGTAS